MASRHILVLFPKDWDRVELDHPRYQAGYRFYYEGFDLFSFPDNARLLTFDARRYVDRLARKYRGRIDGVISNNEHFGALIASRAGAAPRPAGRRSGGDHCRPAQILFTLHAATHRARSHAAV